MTEAHSIAEKLTPSQRRALLAAKPIAANSSYGLRTGLQTADALASRGLFRRDASRPGAFYSPQTAIGYYLTPMGAAVQCLLREQVQS